MNREDLIEKAAKAMYEAPDLGDDTAHTWPPSHSTDREWWLSRADAALTVCEAASLSVSDGSLIVTDGSLIVTDPDHSELLANVASSDDERAALSSVHRAVQGEPTDAQVLAAQSALLSDIGWVRYSYVRNALRAAIEGGQR